MTHTTSEQWLDDVRDDAQARLLFIAQIQDELSHLYAEARTCEGRIRVRVNAAGRPTALTLEPTALALSAPDLAAAILRATDEAASAANERLTSLVGHLLPAGELDAILTGRPTEADRIAVRDELTSFGPAMS